MMKTQASLQKQRHVCIVIFDDVEVLDFCGPFEVFTVTGGRDGSVPFLVSTVSETGEIITARGGLRVEPAHSFETCPTPDILVVPGGMGTRREMKNPRMLTWLKETSAKAELTLSVCSGALLLGQAGLLDG